MSNLFNYIFATHFVNDSCDDDYDSGDEGKYNHFVTKIINKLCGERYGAIYIVSHWIDTVCGGYEHSIKYLLYDNKPLSKTIYMDKKENYSMFRGEIKKYNNTDKSPDIIIHKIKKDNICYEYTNDKYGVNFSYTYDNKEININLNTDQEYNVEIEYTGEPEFDISINTHTGKYHVYFY